MNNEAQTITVKGSIHTIIRRMTPSDHRAEGLRALAAMYEQTGIVADVWTSRPRSRHWTHFYERCDAKGQTYYQYVTRMLASA